MKKIWLFLSLLICSTLVAGCFKILDWDWMVNEVDEPIINEPIVNEPEILDEVEPVEEPELSEIEKLKQSFVWNIIDWKVDKESLTLQPSNISFNVEWDDTLYYLNEFWIALVLWEDWKWWKVENAYEWKNLASVWLKKSWNKTYWFFLIDNEYYHTRQENPQPDEELVWENNKYHIVMRTVKNWGKDWSFDLVVYDVE